MTSRIEGKMPHFIIIDEVSELRQQHWDWLLGKEPIIEPINDPSMFKKNGKMVKRHHPIPQTPRSPRRR